MKIDVRKMVTAAAFTALICVATMIIQIPMPLTNGYVNLGDGFIIAAAAFIGMPWSAAAAGIGSALADLLTGYAYYCPATLIIKSLMAVACCCIFKAVDDKKTSVRFLGRTAGAVAAELIMMSGYFLFSALFLLSGNFAAAAASIPGNLIQGAFGVLSGMMLVTAIDRTGAAKRLGMKCL